MDHEFKRAEQSNAVALSQRIEDAIPAAKVSNLGWLVMVRFENGSIFTLAPLTNRTCDMNGTDSQDQKHEFNSVAWDDALKLLQDLEAGQPVHEISRLEHPFGEDPLGQHDRNPQEKENSEGKRKSPITHNWENGSPLALNESGPRMLYGSELFQYLKEVLPVAEDEAFIDDAGNFVVSVSPVRVRVIPKGANLYDVETFVGDKREPQQVQLSHAETVRYVFDLVSTVQRFDEPPALAGGNDDSQEIDFTDSYEELRELAGELGKPTDVLRNKELFNLRAGLVTEAKRNAPATNDLLSGLDRHLQKFGALKHQHGEPAATDMQSKVKWFRGHPVAMRGGMNGKALRYVQDGGALIVSKRDIPPTDAKQLSWTDAAGVVMVPITEQAKRPSWKPFRR